MRCWLGIRLALSTEHPWCRDSSISIALWCQPATYARFDAHYRCYLCSSRRLYYPAMKPSRVFVCYAVTILRAVNHGSEGNGLPSLAFHLIEVYSVLMPAGAPDHLWLRELINWKRWAIIAEQVVSSSWLAASGEQYYGFLSCLILWPTLSRRRGVDVHRFRFDVDNTITAMAV
jgi:hypothetical protein